MKTQAPTSTYDNSGEVRRLKDEIGRQRDEIERLRRNSHDRPAPHQETRTVRDPNDINRIRSLEEQARSRPERESRNRIQHSATVDGAVNGQPTAVDTAENMATKPIAGGNTIKDRLMAGGS